MARLMPCDIVDNSASVTVACWVTICWVTGSSGSEYMRYVGVVAGIPDRQGRTHLNIKTVSPCDSLSAISVLSESTNARKSGSNVSFLCRGRAE